MTRGQRGRLIGRGMIGLTILAIALTALEFVAAPGHTGGPMMNYNPRLGPIPVDLLLSVTGIAGVVIGLAWMIWIHRADPEPDQHAWRYRQDR